MMTPEEKLEEMAIRDTLTARAYARGVNNTLIAIGIIIVVFFVCAIVLS